MNVLRAFLSVTALALLLAACSNESDNGVQPDDDIPTFVNETTPDASGSFWITTLDASATDNSVHYSFSSRDVVNVSDAEATSSTAWHIGFKRDAIKLNGGVSGPGGLRGANVVKLGLTGPGQFANVTPSVLSGVNESEWLEDGVAVAVDSLWDYNPVTHQLSPKQYVYILKDAAGHLVKFQLLKLIDPQGVANMGRVIIRFVYQSDADSTDLSGPVITDTLDGTSGSLYYDFSNRSTAMPSDPSNSLDWDFHLVSYSLHLNGSASGPGQGAAFPVYDGLSNPTDFAEIEDLTDMPVVQWFQDEAGSVFADWYDYSGPPNHLLTSKQHIYVLHAGEDYYKVMVVSYYDPSGPPSSKGAAKYTIHWSKL